MREVISVQIGQFGNNLGERYLETISEEHGVGYDGRIAKTATPEQREKIPVHFQIGRTGRCVPRTVLVDSDPHCLDRIAATFSGGLCRPENFLAVGQDPASTWARGVLWAENLERVIDIVRQETEFCDCPQTLQVYHSLGGGTGSGCGSFLITALRDAYPSLRIDTVTLLPAPLVSDTVLEPLNALLSIPHLADANYVQVCDNEALYDICFRILDLRDPNYTDLNDLVSFAIAGLSSPNRFPSYMNPEFHKLAAALTPFPRLNLLTIGVAPLGCWRSRRQATPTAATLVSQLFKPRNLFNSADPGGGRYLSAVAVFRGRVSARQVDAAMLKHGVGEVCEPLIQAVPHAVIASTPAAFFGGGCKASVSFVSCQTAVRSLLSRIHKQFSAMEQRRAFIHWYVREGLEEDQFGEASDCLLQLVGEYEAHDRQLAALDAEIFLEDEEDEEEDSPVASSPRSREPSTRNLVDDHSPRRPLPSLPGSLSS
eukprot:GHVU01111473.1.p1 GENE.GHVU01111473.1~~GHVU01111473.1.p1  ORF type:complete len:484 (-),score=85.80 GHVU01111473.1:1207-2658(-)